MDFCHALANQGKKFKFSLSIGSTFTFSLDTREGKETLPARSKKSPSTLKRNAKRRQEILKKKSEPVLTGMESNQKPIEKDDAFQCNQCEIGFKTRNGLKIHVGKTHKEANPLRSCVNLLQNSSSLCLLSEQRQDKYPAMIVVRKCPWPITLMSTIFKDLKDISLSHHQQIFVPPLLDTIKACWQF